MPKPKKPKASKPKKDKKPAPKYKGFLVWFKVDLYKKTGKKATEAIIAVRDQLLGGLKEELDAKSILLRKEQPEDKIPYVLLDLDEAKIDGVIKGTDLLSKLRSLEMTEWIEVEQYAGIEYGDR
jgi:hypothetical protein